MTFIKFLFVLALAVPLAVFMLYYLNKLLTEFKNNMIKEKNHAKASYIEYEERESKQKGRGVHKRAEKRRRKTIPADKSSDSKQDYREAEHNYDRGYGSGYEVYGSIRSNFDNSKMKRKYEESLKKQNEEGREHSKEKRHKQTESDRTKSKRKRREERRNKKRSREQ